MKKADLEKEGMIFNIQKFCVNDGPGIRTVVFFKGCPLICKWCSNPESQYNQSQVLWDQKKCINCHHCIETCPTNAITLFDGHIQINTEKCKKCRHCITECPGSALEMEGEVKTVKEVMDIVMQDQVFYEESGGGITLSGGEFLSQPEFAIELLLAAKEKGVHTCCETTGYANTDIFNRVIEHIDYLLFDMKHWDPVKHKEGTGVTNHLPFANMHYAVKMGKEVLPRIPVIPGYNDSLEDAVGLSESLLAIGAQRCQLLPFHQFGENKYHLLNKTYEYENISSLHEEELQDYLNVFVKLGIDVFF